MADNSGNGMNINTVLLGGMGIIGTLFLTQVWNQPKETSTVLTQIQTSVAGISTSIESIKSDLSKVTTQQDATSKDVADLKAGEAKIEAAQSSTDTELTRLRDRMATYETGRSIRHERNSI